MSARAGATADQIAAHVRDLTPGQLVELIRALAAQVEGQALMLAAQGHPQAGVIGLAGNLSRLAGDLLREAVPGECVAEPLAAINALLRPKGGSR